MLSPIPSVLPHQEAERLMILRSYGVLDTPPEERFDRIARFAADLAGTPIAMVSLVDEHRLFFKGRVGIDTCEASHEDSFCTRTIASDGPLVVNDVAQDPRFAVPGTGSLPCARFYAGVPLLAPSGHRLGALCVVDTKPRTISERTLEQLQTLAALVVDELELVQRTAEQSLKRVQHAQEIAVREEAFRALAENAPDIVARYDRDLRVLYVNPMAEQVSGIPRALQIGTVAGRPGAASVHVPGWADQLRSVFETGAQRRVPFSYTCIDGQVRRYEALLVPERDATGQTTTVLACARDVTEYVEAQQRYRALLTLVRSFAYACDVPADGARPTITWITGSVEDVLGHSSSAYEGQAWGDHVCEADRPILDRHLAAVLTGDSRVDDLRLCTSEGRERWIRLVSQPEADPETGRVVRIYGAGQDVTERKGYEAELVQAKEMAEELARLKDAFLANMSHEIRTPLTSILGFAELLHEVVDAEGRELVEYIQAGAQRLRDTLTSVLELSQLQAGHVELTTRPVAPAPLIDDTLRILSSQASKSSVRLTSWVEPRCLPALAERGALGRILVNLVGNAIKFTRPGGCVHVSAATEGDRVAITVADTGVGMSEDFVPHVFEDFRQESQGLSRRYEGSGLGLAITKRLVDLMEGTIEVESTKGTGTVVTLRLPAAASTAEVNEAVPGGAPELARNAHILLVEDDESTHVYMERVTASMQVERAATAEDGVTKAEAAERPFDVVLVDINLGGGTSGLDLLPLLRRVRACQTACFVAMTAYALPGDEERFLDAGFDRYIAKPFTRDALMEVLRPPV